MALPRFAEGLPQYPPPRRRSYRNSILVGAALLTIFAIFYNSHDHVASYYDKYAGKLIPSTLHSHNAGSGAQSSAEDVYEHENLPGKEPGMPADRMSSMAQEWEAMLSTALAHTSHPSSSHPTLPSSESSASSRISSSPFSSTPSSAVTTSTLATSARSTTSSKPSATPSGPPIPDDIPVDHSQPRLRVTQQMQELLTWDPPTTVIFHVPAYSEYLTSDYDPNRWENFTINNEFFEQGFLTSAEAAAETPVAYAPYPKYNGRAWRQKWRGEFVPCEGIQGKNLNETDEEQIKAYKQKPHGFPNPQVGSWDAVGLDGSVCFDRLSRLGAYGIGDDRDFGGLKLGELQNKCLQRNKDRYELSANPVMRPDKDIPLQTPEEYMRAAKISSYKTIAPGPQYKPRTAVLIRSWEHYEYLDNDVQAIRSLVSELSLQSGGEYQVFLLVNIKDEDDSIFIDENAYQTKMLYIPEELRDMTVLWTEKQMESIYPAVGEYRVGLAQFMPVQWFMETHPEFEFVWNWEMDARLIGQHYGYVEAINEFALQQPRKYLWERNARFYLPGVHGSYKDFFDDTNRQIKESPFVSTIWGPMLIGDVLGPEPPTAEDQDNFSWGVGEEADFISLLPIWDPARPTWGWKYSMWNYPSDSPRRAYINTHARYSRRLLKAMHLENLNGRHMHSEMWPTSIALHHGLKAVYAPQPIWMSHHWPDFYLDAVFNAEGWGSGSFYNYSEPADDGINQPLNHPGAGRGVAYNETLARLRLPQNGVGPNREGAMGRWSQERDSPYNIDREHNFQGWSWYYSTDFAKIVYSRWLGWQQTFSALTIGFKAVTEVDKLWDAGTEEWEESHGRLCLPSMMLHPVKHMINPMDDIEEDEEDNGQQGGQGEDENNNNWPQFEQQNKQSQNGEAEGQEQPEGDEEQEGEQEGEVFTWSDSSAADFDQSHNDWNNNEITDTDLT